MKKADSLAPFLIGGLALLLGALLQVPADDISPTILGHIKGEWKINWQADTLLLIAVACWYTAVRRWFYKTRR